MYSGSGSTKKRDLPPRARLAQSVAGVDLRARDVAKEEAAGLRGKRNRHWRDPGGRDEAALVETCAVAAEILTFAPR